MTVAFTVALAVPIVGMIVPEFFIVRDLGLFDTKLGLVLFYSAMFFPLSFVIQRAFLASLPFELEEAAMMDGAGYFRIISRIVAPLAVPGLATVAVLVFIFIWNEYFFAQLLTVSFGNLNIQVTLAEFRSAFQRDTTAQLAGTTIAMLVPIGAFIALQRYVISGLTAGSLASQWHRSRLSTNEAIRRDGGRRRPQYLGRRRRVPRARRTLRLWQDHRFAHARRTRRISSGRILIGDASSTTSRRVTATLRWCSSRTPSIRI